jgi:flagellar hook-basal body complex protein FliE
MAIPGIGPGLTGAAGIGPSLPTSPSTGQSTGADQGTGSAFGQLLDGLTQSSSTATNAMSSIATGGSADLHDVTLSVQMESLAFDLAVQIRNKLVDAYQEIFRMSV